jgi:hypothetical protein
MINAVGIEGGGAALDAVDGIALIKEQFSEIGAILAGDTGN